MSKCKSCLHAIKLHKHPLNRMYNGAISEQVDFGGCIANGKDNGIIVDRVVDECGGWKPNCVTINVGHMKNRIEVTSKGKYWFDCTLTPCYANSCFLYGSNISITTVTQCRELYDWKAISAHDFGTLTEVIIEDLEQFKIK